MVEGTTIAVRFDIKEGINKVLLKDLLYMLISLQRTYQD